MDNIVSFAKERKDFNKIISNIGKFVFKKNPKGIYSDPKDH